MDELILLALIKKLQRAYFPSWDASTSYTEGQLVIHNNAPYQKKAGASTVGTWVDAEWELYNLESVVQLAGDSEGKMLLGINEYGMYVKYEI